MAFLGLLVLLGNLRDAGTVSAVIPLSVLGRSTLMEWKGLTLNTVTLAGLAIGVGNLVDGAIVVQENIARHRALGKDPVAAAIEGTQGAFAAVTASNLTAIAVFFPLIFVTGVVGQIFGGLSWAVIFSQITSQVMAFTLIPMMSALLGRSTGKSDPRFERLGRAAAPWTDRYAGWLGFALRRPARVLGLVTGGLFLSLGLLSVMPRTLFPTAEGKEILLRRDLPMGSPLSATNDVALSVERVLKEIPGITHQAVTVGSIPQEGLQPLGPHQAQIVLELTEGRRLRFHVA